MIAPIEAEQLAAAKDALVRFDADKVKRQGSSGRSYSAVLFGPPGTAKTTICEAVAKKLGWSFLVVDTSAFLADGEPTARESITILQSTPLKSSHFSHSKPTQFLIVCCWYLTSPACRISLSPTS